MRPHRPASDPASPSVPLLEAPPAAPNPESMYAAELKLISTLLRSLQNQMATIQQQQDDLLDELTAIKAQLTEGIVMRVNPHAIEPDPDTDLHPVFDHDGREIEGGPGESVQDVRYPLTASCRCGAQIMKIGPGAPWGHSS